MKSRSQILSEVIEAKQKRLLELQVKHLEDNAALASSFSVSAAVYAETFGGIAALKRELEVLEKMLGEIPEENSITGDKDVVVDFLSKQSDGATYRITVIEE